MRDRRVEPFQISSQHASPEEGKEEEEEDEKHRARFQFREMRAQTVCCAPSPRSRVFRVLLAKF